MSPRPHTTPGGRLRFQRPAATSRSAVAVGGALAGHTVLDRLRPHRLPTLVLTAVLDRCEQG
ncbi:MULTISPECIES: hypothetical protein [unclassified Geodermatophilus]